MPRPATLETIDWKSVFESGKNYSDWLEIAEKQEQRDKMEELRASLSLEAAQVAYLEALPRAVHVIAIAESWCGDVHRHVPVLEKLSEHAPKLRVSYVTREQHPNVFARFLTNGGEAIPKFVFLSDQYVETGSWGPMPADCRRIISRGKAANDLGAARKRVSLMYEADPNCEIVIRELLEMIDTAVAVVP